jgi:cytochrome P450
VRQSSLPPGPTKPAIAQMIEYVRDPWGYFAKQQKVYGDIFTVTMVGVGKQVVVSSPEALREVVGGDYEQYERSAEVLRYFLGGRALIFQEGMPHRRMRKVMGPPFQGDRMRSYGPVMRRVTDEVLARMPDGELTMSEPMQEITMRVILHCIFGLDEGPRLERVQMHLVQFMKAMLTPWAFIPGLVLKDRVLKVLERLGERQRSADPDRPPTISRWPVLREADHLGAIDAIIFDEIERCERSPAGRQDILAMLVMARDEEGQPLSKKELRDQLIMLMLAGYETTSNSLCWALYLIAKHPEVLSAIRREQEQVFAQGFDPLAVSSLPYLGATIQESMRMMPIAVGVARKLKQDLSVGGYTIKAGTLIMPASYLAQHDPRLWKDPENFDPTRFMGKKPGPSAHFPFGQGVWRCLGAAFADYEMRIVLARLLMRFDIELGPDQKPKPLLQGITVSPIDGMPIRLKKRAVQQAVKPVTPAEPQTGTLGKVGLCPFHADNDATRAENDAAPADQTPAAAGGRRPR